VYSNTGTKKPITSVQLGLYTPCSTSYFQQSGLSDKRIYQYFDFAFSDTNEGAELEDVGDIQKRFKRNVDDKCSYDYNAGKYLST